MSLSASESTTRAKTQTVSLSSPRFLPRKAEIDESRLDINVVPGFGIDQRIVRHAIDETGVVEPVASWNEIVVVRMLPAHLQHARRRKAAERDFANVTKSRRNPALRVRPALTSSLALLPASYFRCRIGMAATAQRSLHRPCDHEGHAALGHVIFASELEEKVVQPFVLSLGGLAAERRLGPHRHVVDEFEGLLVLSAGREAVLFALHVERDLPPVDRAVGVTEIVDAMRPRFAVAHARRVGVGDLGLDLLLVVVAQSRRRP